MIKNYRYRIIFIWKIAMKLTDGYNLEFQNEGTRRGRECVVANIVRHSPTAVKNARENSLMVKGARMFNLLPAQIRNISADKVQIFKTKLDEFLSNIPDQPTSAIDGRAAATNCLLDQIPWAKQNYVTG